ncbi:MAG: AI-2E family transporter [Deltaproteobacteria bacterium]|nr:AI-2E family transporter [Deltaproteobacteria bacterium]
MANNKQLEQRAFILLLVALIASGLYLISPFLLTLILGIVLTVLFHPMHEKFLKWTKQRHNLAAFLSVTAVVLFFFIPMTILLTLVTTQLASLVTQSNFSISETTVSGIVAKLQNHLTFLGAKFEYLSGLNFNLVPLIQKVASQAAQIVAEYSPAVLSGTVNFLLHLFILVIALFYLFRDGKFFFNLLIRISPVKDQYELRLAKEIRETIYGVFYGNFLTGLAQAVLATVGFYFAGIQAFFVWGAVTFFMSFLPMLGTGAVIIPITLILFLQGKTNHALFLAIYGGVMIGSVDNLLRPVLIRSNMHPLVLFLSIFGGLAVFGAFGILLGPMILALLTATRIEAARVGIEHLSRRHAARLAVGDAFFRHYFVGPGQIPLIRGHVAEAIGCPFVGGRVPDLVLGIIKL